MTSRNPGAGAVLLLLMATAGCGAGAAGRPPSGASPWSGPSASGAYNADQLTQALLIGIPGYQRSGVPQWGQYSSLTAVQNSHELQQAVKLDKPQCASSTRAPSGDGALRTAPSALIAFVKGRDQSVSETLMAVGPDVAAQQVGLRVPAECRAFRVLAAGRWASAQVVEASGTRIGEGSRSVGIATTVGAVMVKTWFVVLRSRGYLAVITLYGPRATQREAEELARQAYQQAERVLP